MLYIKKNGALVPVGGSGGGGSDGFTFVQEATPTADTHGQTWYDTSTGDSFVWIVDADSSQWVQFAPGGGGGGGDGLLLSSETETTKILDTWMDTYSDFTVGNRDIHPFPTIIEVAISGIYIKPDRTHQCSASLLDYNVADPSNPGYASIADFTQTVTSNGANWTALGGVAVSAPVAAGATSTIVLRIFGVSGGATGVSFQFVTTSKRYRA